MRLVAREILGKRSIVNRGAKRRRRSRRRREAITEGRTNECKGPDLDNNCPNTRKKK